MKIYQKLLTNYSKVVWFFLGNETVLNREATRFEYVERHDVEDYFYTLWATTDDTIADEETVWLPIR